MKSCENAHMQMHLLDRRLPASRFTYQCETQAAVRRRINTTVTVLQSWVEYRTRLLFYDYRNFGCHKTDNVFW